MPTNHLQGSEGFNFEEIVFKPLKQFNCVNVYWFNCEVKSHWPPSVKLQVVIGAIRRANMMNRH